MPSTKFNAIDFPLRVPEALQESFQKLNNPNKSNNNNVTLIRKSSRESSRQPRQRFNFNGFNGPVIRVTQDGDVDDDGGNSIDPPPPVTPGVFSCGHRGSDIFMNFINPSFPDKDDTVGSCVFKIDIARPEICQIRVDFVDTELQVPKTGNCIGQFMQVAGPIWPTGFSRLCGLNSDQHFYVHINREEEGETVDLIVNTVTQKNYKFGFWITQIDCSVETSIAAPAGCTQFHLGDQGTIKTFNFEGVQYLANQNYNICIRSELDACYMVFQVDANQFFLQMLLREDTNRGLMNRFRQSRDGSSNPAARGAEECGLDYIMIPGGRANASRIGEIVVMDNELIIMFLCTDSFQGLHMTGSVAAD